MSEIELTVIKSDSEEAEIKIETNFVYSKLRNTADEIKATFEELMMMYENLTRRTSVANIFTPSIHKKQFEQ